MEVATARVYNWDVTMKRKEKNDQEAIEEKGESGSPNGWIDDIYTYMMVKGQLKECKRRKKAGQKA